jgi:Trypsin-co-occurring domain 2
MIWGGIPVEATENLVSLRDFIASLRSELKAAHNDAEQDASPDGPRFVVGPVSVEFTLTAKKDASAKGGVRFYVFELGASGSVSSETTQRVSLTLTPQTLDGDEYKVSEGPMAEDPQ